MQCPDWLRLQAYFDGEVDALTAAEIEQHTAHCTDCRRLLRELEYTRAAIHDLAAEQAPPELRLRIDRALDRETPAASRSGASLASPWRTRSFWLGAFGGVGGSIAAACCAWLLLSPSLNPLLDDLVSAHVRSLMPSHLTDVVSTDQHTVKPWFAGHADVSPVVADFAAQGFRLVGGRADYLDHQRAAVVVYTHGPHVINVFSWATQSPAAARSVSRNGYHLAFWSDGNVAYCAVSDTGWDELQTLVRLLRDRGAGEVQR